MEFTCNFNVLMKDHSLSFHLITHEKNTLSGYRIVPQDEADLPEIRKLLESVHADESLTINELSNRLRVLDEVSHVDVRVSHLVMPYFPQGSDERMSRLVRMVRNRESDEDLRALCRECLSLNSQNPRTALAELRKAFNEAGAGLLSDKITDMLLKEASDMNVDEIRAFGRKKTTDVASFINALPHTSTGAIDLTRMKKLDAGGTHDIFILKDGESPYVVKINRESIKMHPEDRQQKYQVNKAAYQKLHDAFGHHCTVEQLLLRTIEDEFGSKDAIISIADFETGFTNESKIHLVTAYFIANEMSIATHPETYEKMLMGLFFPGQETLFDFNTYLTFNPNAEKMATLIKNDADYGRAMKEFLILFKEYFKQSGQYLDIQGNDNIIFFKEDDRWTFKLGSVIKQETKQDFSKALDWIASKAAEPPDPDLHWKLKHCLHWTKTLNALGMGLGVGRVIDDDNNHRVHELWSLLKAREVMMPLKTERIYQIGISMQNLPPEEIIKSLKAMDFNPLKEMDLLKNLFSGFTPEKQLVLAHYLHQVLPRAISEKPDLRFCAARYTMAESLKNFPEGRALALEFLRDVSHDPEAPKVTVQQMINELENFTSNSIGKKQEDKFPQ